MKEKAWQFFIEKLSIPCQIIALLLVCVALLLLASGCSAVDLAAETTVATAKQSQAEAQAARWQPSHPSTEIEHETWDNKGVFHDGREKVYVYECTVGMARISPVSLFGKATWVERSALEGYFDMDDVCEPNEPDE